MAAKNKTSKSATYNTTSERDGESSERSPWAFAIALAALASLTAIGALVWFGETQKGTYGLLGTSAFDWLTAIGGLVVVIVGARWAVHKFEAEKEKDRRAQEEAAKADRRQRKKAAEAERLLEQERYVMPFLMATEALQSRLYNILEGRGLGTLREAYLEEKGDDSIGLHAYEIFYSFAEFFGWSLYLRLYSKYGRDTHVTTALSWIAKIMASDRGFYGRSLMIFRPQQRNLGQLVVQRLPKDRNPEVLPFDEFVKRMASPTYAAAASPFLKTVSAAKGPKDLGTGRARFADLQVRLARLLEHFEHLHEDYRLPLPHGERKRARPIESGGIAMTDDRPRLQVPPGATDTHMHFYDTAERYPIAPTAAFLPPPARVADYRELQRRLGLERVVVVQPSAYGTDNRCTMDAVAALGDAARAIVVVDQTVGDAELERLTEAGARGIRFHMFRGGVLPWDILEEMAARVHPFGWHVQLQCNGRELPERLAMLKRLPGSLVIDHVGRFMDPVPLDHPAFRCLLGLLESGRTWVKLSAPYESSRSGPPAYEDVSALAQALVRAAPERMLWASNWPHPGQSDPQVRDAALLLDLLIEWAPEEATRRRILVDNPAALYGF